MKTQIYYFSGTGNSLQVARDLARLLDGASIQSIAENAEADLSAEAVGIVFPVYIWGVPAMVLQFLEKLKENAAGRYCFAVATYKADAGDAIGQIKRKLNSLGIRLSAGFTIAMPGNNIVFYDTEPEREQVRKLDACKYKINEIAKAVRSKQEILPVSSAVDRLLKTGLLNPIITGTFKNSDKRFWTRPGCTGCGNCVRVCPADNIKLVGGRPVWLHNCQQCMCCINLCPGEAIQSGKTTLKRGRYRNPECRVDNGFSEYYDKGIQKR